MVTAVPTSMTTGTMLTLMSIASGCMDILSYVLLGQVFTSAMTGNAALLGLGIGQGNLGAMSRSLAAFLAFLSGLLLGALLLRWTRSKSGQLGQVTSALLLESVLLVGFAWLWHVAAGPSTGGKLYCLVALSAMAMGVQSAVAHRLGVPGITTTYFTGTITTLAIGVVGDGVAQRRPDQLRWPILAFLAYLLGAVLTGYLVPNVPAPTPIHGFGLPALPALLVALAVLVSLVRTATLVR